MRSLPALVGNWPASMPNHISIFPYPGHLCASASFALGIFKATRCCMPGVSTKLRDESPATAIHCREGGHPVDKGDRRGDRQKTIICVKSGGSYHKQLGKKETSGTQPLFHGNPTPLCMLTATVHVLDGGSSTGFGRQQRCCGTPC